MRASNRPALDRLSDALVLCSVVAVILYLIVVSGRGFDITDEGYYVLSARYSDQVSSWSIYAGAVFRLLGYDLVYFRSLGILCLVASSVVLAIGLARLIARINDSQDCAYASFVGMTCLGSLLYYSWFLPTPSYNTLNAITLNCALGLFFVSLCGQLGIGEQRIVSSNYFAAFAAGTFLGADLFAKFPTAIVAFSSLSVLYLIWPSVVVRDSLQLTLSFASGFVTWLAFHFLAVQSLPAWWRLTRDGFTAAQLLDPSRDVSNTLIRYCSDSLELAGQVISDNWHLYLALFGVVVWLRHNAGKPGRPTSRWTVTALIAAISIATVLALHRDLHVSGMDRLFFVARLQLSALGLLGLVALVLRTAHPIIGPVGRALRQRRLCVALLTLALFLAPFAFAFGTGNPMSSFIALFLGAWFGLYGWLFLAMRRSHTGSWIAAAGKTFVLVFTCSQVMLGSWRHPYRINGSLGEQNVLTAIGYPATKLALDAPTSRFLGQVRTVLDASGYRPGSDMLGFFDVQGVIYSVGGRMLGKPWLSGAYPGSRVYAERALETVSQHRLRRAFILQTFGSTENMPDLSKFDLDFPDGYILCGEFPNPYSGMEETVRIWKPASHS